MAAAAEGQVLPRILPADVEPVRGVEDLLVVVGRRERDHHGLPGGDGDPADLDVSRCRTPPVRDGVA